MRNSDIYITTRIFGTECHDVESRDRYRPTSPFSLCATYTCTSNDSRDTGERELDVDNGIVRSSDGFLLAYAITKRNGVGKAGATVDPCRRDNEHDSGTRVTNGIFRWCNQNRDQGGANLRTIRSNRR